MVSTPKIELAQLRQIGWSEWDPISLQEIDPDWRSDGGEDEYDSYLLHVVGLIKNERSEAEAIQYLVQIERKHMEMELWPLDVRTLVHRSSREWPVRHQTNLHRIRIPSLY